MGKTTHFANFASHAIRAGGIKTSLKGGQNILPSGVPSNWYPANLPIASTGVASNSDCKALLDRLAPLVAMLTIQQSVALACSYRTVQNNVLSGGTFTVNGVTSNSVQSAFDYGYRIGEQVPVDIVSKNPSLTYDLAVRLAQATSVYIDRSILGAYAYLTPTAVGAQGVTPTLANLTSAVGSLPVNGEPAMAIISTSVLQAMISAGNVPNGYRASLYSAPYPMGAQTPTPSGVNPGAVNRQYRLFASDNVSSTGSATVTVHNVMITPSAFAFASTDMGNVFGATTPSFLTGYTQVSTSIATDPEYSSSTPQLALQLVISNTGSGAQFVYVNLLGNVVVANPANGVQILA